MFNNTYTSLANRFETWLQANNEDTLITDVTLDYLNRAQEWLQIEKAWQGLVVDISLTITSGTATLPSDFISLVSLGYSHDNDGFINWYYYRDQRGSEGYHVATTFTKAAGVSYQLKFFSGYPYQPNICRYQKKLDNFEGSGAEYSFFPGELLLSVAKLLRIEDYEPEGADYTTTLRAINRLLKKYKNLEFQNNKLQMTTLDDYGNPIEIVRGNLAGNQVGEGSKIITDVSQDT